VERRYATLVATVLDTVTILIDETLEMHERIVSKYFKKAEHKHLQTFQENGKAINDKVRLYALIGGSAFAPAVTATPTDRSMRVTAMILG
jgi:hypothetical protein